jgi:hypothetical protein
MNLFVFPNRSIHKLTHNMLKLLITLLHFIVLVESLLPLSFIEPSVLFSCLERPFESCDFVPDLLKHVHQLMLLLGPGLLFFFQDFELGEVRVYLFMAAFPFTFSPFLISTMFCGSLSRASFCDELIDSSQIFDFLLKLNFLMLHFFFQSAIFL